MSHPSNLAVTSFFKRVAVLQASVIRCLLLNTRIYSSTICGDVSIHENSIFYRVVMELKETLKSKSEEGDTYIAEIEVCWMFLMLKLFREFELLSSPDSE